MSISLIITDDDEEFRLVLQKASQRKGLKPILCRNGYELVDALHASRLPALVFLDIHMDHKDGIEVIEDLKSIDRRFRLRFMTGGADAHAVAAKMIAQARGLDVGRTLYKPFSIDQFGEVIDADTKSLLK